MRHLWTLIAAAVVAPLAWVLLAYGQDRSLQAFANGDSQGALRADDFFRPLVCLAAAGLLFGLLATLRFSPLGAVLTGVVYTATYVALLVNPNALLRVFPNKLSVAGRVADPTTPMRTGAALVLGALLLVGVASVGRWRRWPRPTGDRDWDDDAYESFPKERPLGVDGLGLAPDRYAEPSHAGRSAWTSENSASTSGWSGTGWS